MRCNEDCEHCIYEDCISNQYEALDRAQKKYYFKYKDKILAYQKEWREKNKSYVSKKGKEYRALHKEHRRQYMREYYRTHRMQIKIKQTRREQCVSNVDKADAPQDAPMPQKPST